MSIIDEIAAERRRQIEVDGWTPEHDDEHDDGEMLHAAMFYLWHGTEKAAAIDADGAPMGWPWSAKWWKPKDRRRNLIRAGALCLAEKERLQRRAGGSARYTGYVDHKLKLIVAEIERLDRLSPPAQETT